MGVAAGARAGPGESAALGVEADPRAEDQQLGVARRQDGCRPASNPAFDLGDRHVFVSLPTSDAYTFSRRCSRSQDEITCW